MFKVGDVVRIKRGDPNKMFDAIWGGRCGEIAYIERDGICGVRCSHRKELAWVDKKHIERYDPSSPINHTKELMRWF